jgi:hypothetical protein
MCQRSRIASGSLCPRHPRPGCRELPVDPLTITAGASRVASDPLCLHAGANTPAGPREWSRSFSAPSSSAFPRFWTGRLLHYQFRGLLSVHSRYDLQTRKSPMRPSTPEAPAALLPPPPLRLLPGGAIQFPGGSFSRCGPAPFSRRTRTITVTTHGPEAANLRVCSQFGSSTRGAGCVSGKCPSRTIV